MKFDLMVFKFFMFRFNDLGGGYRWRVNVNQSNSSVTVTIVSTNLGRFEVASIKKEFDSNKDINKFEVKKMKKELWADVGPELMEKHRLSRLS